MASRAGASTDTGGRLMLRCRDCKGSFAESLADRVQSVTPFEFWGTRGLHTEIYLACPFCACEELDEVIEETPDEVPEASCN